MLGLWAAVGIAAPPPAPTPTPLPAAPADVREALKDRLAANPCGPGDDGTCVCRHLCGGAWPKGEETTVSWPFGPSGSTAAGLVPLGPRLVLALGPGGDALRCGVVTPPAEAPPCAGSPVGAAGAADR